MRITEILIADGDAALKVTLCVECRAMVTHADDHRLRCKSHKTRLTTIEPSERDEAGKLVTTNLAWCQAHVERLIGRGQNATVGQRAGVCWVEVTAAVIG
jgi:hypothetical protein